MVFIAWHQYNNLWFTFIEMCDINIRYWCGYESSLLPARVSRTPRSTPRILSQVPV